MVLDRDINLKLRCRKILCFPFLISGADVLVILCFRLIKEKLLLMYEFYLDLSAAVKLPQVMRNLRIYVIQNSGKAELIGYRKAGTVLKQFLQAEQALG